MEITACIDWLSCSGSLELYDRLEQTKFRFRRGHPVEAIKRYPQGWELEPAGTLFVSETEQQGSLITFSGSQMQILREKCHDDGIVLSELLPFTRCSRIDFAVDIHEPINLRRLEHHIHQKTYSTKFKSDPLRLEGISGKSGYTLYFGSPKSDRRVRVYDKAAEMKLLNIAWSRVEFQNRHKRAELLALDMVKSDWQDVGKAAIKDCLDFPNCKWWKECLVSGDVPLTQLPRKLSRFENWLESQVKPAILGRIESGSHAVFIADWLEGLLEASTESLRGSESLDM